MRLHRLTPGRLTVAVVFCALLASGSRASACTTFVLHTDHELVFGRSLDWVTGVGIVVVNKRNVAKRALIFPPDRPAEWISKYGSVTFNQVGRELPYGGINEAGLVVENMWLDETRYPEPGSRPLVSEVQWIQYQLDNFATVGEVLAGDSSLCIGQSSTPLHFLICDRFGTVAVVEFLNGHTISYTGKELPVPVLTNSTYERSLRCLQENPDSTSNSLRRFATAARMAETADGLSPDSTIAYAFDILESVRKHSTQWQVVYDVLKREIHFRSAVSPQVKLIALGDFDFDCTGPVEVIDVDINRPGVVPGDFVEYSTEINERIIRLAMKDFWEAGLLTNISDSTLTHLARYPESLPCAGETR